MATYILEYIPGLASVVIVGHLNLPDTKRFVDAATLSTMVTNITCLSVGLGLASALDTLCSQAYGAKSYKKMGIYLQSSILVLGISLVPMFLINWWFTESILLACGQDKEVSHLAGQFSKVTIWGMPFLYMYELHRKLLQSQSVMRPLVFIAIIGNTINILGGYFLTYHTSWNFLGAAFSRTLGYASMMFLLIVYYYHERVFQLWWGGWDWVEARRHVPLFLRLGFPGMLTLVLEWSAFEIMAVLAGVLKHGVIEVSAHAVLTNVASLLYMAYLGIAVSGNIRVGVALGANEPRKARLICWLSFGTVFALGVFLATMIFLLRHRIPTIIVNDKDSIQ
jgi:MATE family multidrug resistance protein